MNAEQALAWARNVHARFVGRVILVGTVEAYRNEDSVTITLDPPGRFRLQPEQNNDLAHRVDDWRDPYWDILPEEETAGRPELQGVTSFWCYGPSIRIGHEYEESENHQNPLQEDGSSLIDLEGCPWCGASECYVHCRESEDGQHEPHLYGASIPQDGTDAERIIVDVPCTRCGVLGSAAIEAKDIQWG